MALVEKPSREDKMLYEIIRHPVLCAEFIQNLDLPEKDEPWEYSDYQEEFICDFSNYISICCARSVGKTESITAIIVWLLVNNVFPNDYIVYTVPNKSHLDPVWDRLTRMFRINSLLKQFVDPRKGINSSEHTLKPTTSTSLICRIAGTTGTGANVVGLHSPFEILDECVVGTQKIYTKYGNKHADTIKIGDSVLSWSGEVLEYRPVISIQKTERKQKVLEIEFDLGKIRVGENHRVYTDSGYIKASELSAGDKIYCYKNTERKYWSEEEENLLVQEIKKSTSVKFIAKELNRTVQSIFGKIDSLGLSVRGIFDSVELSDTEYQIILGSALGDGSLAKEIYRARYTTNHSLKQKEYVDWLYKNLKRITRTKPRISKNGGWGTLNYAFGTLGHPKILDIYNKLYIGGKKTITREYLDLLGPLGLAVWFMDDGSKSGMWSTHSFTKEENGIISDYLKETWNIDSKVYFVKDKDLYCILIHNRSLEQLKNIVKSFIPQSMRYKIGEGSYNNSLPDLEIISPVEDNNTLVEKNIIRIKEINTRSKYLYNFEVEENHNYFVNGILTKNSGYYPWGTWIELQPTQNSWQKGFRLIVSGVPTGLREKNVCYYADEQDDKFSHHRISSHQNPRYSGQMEQENLEQFGGKDGDDYIHLVLGKHGAPTFAVFDRNNMKIEPYPVLKTKVDGITMDVGEIMQRLAAIPGIDEKYDYTLVGVDLGYTEPTAIHILYSKSGELKYHARVQLTKIQYPLQKKLFDFLDDKFGRFDIIGVDVGGPGKPVVQDWLEADEFVHKDYKKRMVSVDFSSYMVLGTNADGTEIKTKMKPFAMSLAQEYSNAHKLVFSSTDFEFISELERTTYTKTPNGDIVYRTLTMKGGARGEDHHTAALLAAVVAHYTVKDASLRKTKSKKLARARFLLSGRR